MAGDEARASVLELTYEDAQRGRVALPLGLRLLLRRGQGGGWRIVNLRQE